MPYYQNEWIQWYQVVPAGVYRAEVVQMRKRNGAKSGMIYVRAKILDGPSAGDISAGEMPKGPDQLQALSAMASKPVTDLKQVKSSEVNGAVVMIRVGPVEGSSGAYITRVWAVDDEEPQGQPEEELVAI